jgi:diguanylate cyclase (GGDEF)-like protein
MLDAQTVSLAGFVSQIVFAATLALLAWKDRRTRGTMWFALASCLQLLETLAHSHLHGEVAVLGEAAGALLQYLKFFLIYMGLRWFVLRRPLRSRIVPLAISAAMAATLVVACFSPPAAAMVARLGVVMMIGWMLPMLIQPREQSMRGPARMSAWMLGGLAVTWIVRTVWDLMNAGYRGGAPELWLQLSTAFFANALSFTFIALFLAESQRRLHEETRLDVLTGLRNRRAMEEIALDEVAMASRQGHPLALLVIDVDLFKRLNDTWGHGAGDTALRMIAIALDTSLRGAGLVGRVGGEEFAVLLPRLRLEGAAAVAEELRAQVERLAVMDGDQRIPVSVSIGVSALRTGERNWIDMLRRADKALYRAKYEGRNRVSTWLEKDGVRGTSHDSAFGKWRRSWSTTHPAPRPVPAEAEPQKHLLSA